MSRFEAGEQAWQKAFQFVESVAVGVVVRRDPRTASRLRN